MKKLFAGIVLTFSSIAFGMEKDFDSGYESPDELQQTQQILETLFVDPSVKRAEVRREFNLIKLQISSLTVLDLQKLNEFMLKLSNLYSRAQALGEQKLAREISGFREKFHKPMPTKKVSNYLAFKRLQF